MKRDTTGWNLLWPKIEEVTVQQGIPFMKRTIIKTLSIS